MIKKISLIFILCFFLISCGKKGDPEYKESQSNSKIPSYLLNKA